MLGGTDWLSWKWHDRRHDSTYESGWVNRSCSLPNTAYPTFHFQPLPLLVKSAHSKINGNIKTMDGWGHLFGILAGGRSCAGLIENPTEVWRSRPNHNSKALMAVCGLSYRHVIWNATLSQNSIDLYHSVIMKSNAMPSDPCAYINIMLWN